MRAYQFVCLIILQVATLLLVAILFIKEKGGSQSSAANGFLLEAHNKGVNYKGNYVYGDDNAPNELVVFTRYNCQYCKDFYNEVFHELKKDFIDKGKLKVVFMVNTSLLDSADMKLSRLAEIGREYNMYEKLQTLFYQQDFQFEEVEFKSFLNNSEMATADWEAKLNDKKYEERIKRQLEEGNRLHITGTPIFFVNGNRKEGYTERLEFIRFLKGNLK